MCLCSDRKKKGENAESIHPFEMLCAHQAFLELLDTLPVKAFSSLPVFLIREGHFVQLIFII